MKDLGILERQQDLLHKEIEAEGLNQRLIKAKLSHMKDTRPDRIEKKKVLLAKITRRIETLTDEIFALENHPEKEERVLRKKLDRSNKTLEKHNANLEKLNNKINALEEEQDEEQNEEQDEEQKNE